MDTVEGPAIPVHPDHDALAAMALPGRQRCSGHRSLLVKEGAPVWVQQHQALGRGVVPSWDKDTDGHNNGRAKSNDVPPVERRQQRNRVTTLWRPAFFLFVL